MYTYVCVDMTHAEARILRSTAQPFSSADKAEASDGIRQRDDPEVQGFGAHTRKSQARFAGAESHDAKPMLEAGCNSHSVS